MTWPASRDPAVFSGLAGRLGDRVIRADPDHLTIGVKTDGSAAQIRALLDEIDPDRGAVRQFSVHNATLDDVFLALTGHAATPAAGTGSQLAKEKVSV